MIDKETRRHCRSSPSTLSLVMLGFYLSLLIICLSEPNHHISNTDAVSLHSEYESHNDYDIEEDKFYASESNKNSDDDVLGRNWHSAYLFRNLKSGGGSRSSSSSSRSSSSYGNCYGDRCDNNGGSVDIAIIVGAVVGGLCFICLVYYGIVSCIESRKDARKKKRKKRNQIGHHDGSSQSDSDVPREPIVLYNNESQDITNNNEDVFTSVCNNDVSSYDFRIQNPTDNSMTIVPTHPEYQNKGGPEPAYQKMNKNQQFIQNANENHQHQINAANGLVGDGMAAQPVLQDLPQQPIIQLSNDQAIAFNTNINNHQMMQPNSVYMDQGHNNLAQQNSMAFGNGSLALPGLDNKPMQQFGSQSRQGSYKKKSVRTRIQIDNVNSAIHMAQQPIAKQVQNDFQPRQSSQIQQNYGGDSQQQL